MSRIADDELAIAVSKSGHVDGVVVDLPLFAAIGFANAAASAGSAVPMLIIAHSPEIVRRTFVDVAATHVNDIPDLVSTVDLMLARHRVVEAAPETHRAAV